MGGALSGLFGGQQSQSSSQSSAAGGYGALPAFDQQAIQNLIASAGTTATAAANTPIPLTSQETTAQNLSAPMTQQSVSQLASNYMNPYQQYLTNAINQNAAAGNSQYQNQVAGSGFAAGTTNRDFLNEGYAQGQTDQAIGQSLANNYGAALSTGLGQQNTDVSQLMGEGANQRQIGLQTSQAPITALQQLAQLMGVMPATSNSQSTSQSTSSNNQGLLSGLGSIAGGLSNGISNATGAGSLSSFFNSGFNGAGASNLASQIIWE